LFANLVGLFQFQSFLVVTYFGPSVLKEKIGFLGALNFLLSGSNSPLGPSWRSLLFQIACTQLTTHSVARYFRNLLVTVIALILDLLQFVLIWQ
jgi:hypothetical protein